ncbi:hypothetical protein C7H19_13525 [Aphanothece hegewaldii CCALA 016]|uniref:DZANK-type domain-containing protein n=1 Tax=Aphanothece hegewaldii CCALA 016 TaxID=2107694 RepID=A0A2T1LWE0_9CHRO|nr:hypothetical protein [Aphanothece hegewaldii]PSF36224.1 hypothetical protein C7H19_13525 [Aphanothece hegewaldii CCALA 016]
MTTICPRCQKTISTQAIKCPHCGNILKAYGHPGMTLHQATQETYLCESCTYHEDDTCTFPQRPFAKSCILYQDKLQKPEQPIILPLNRRIKNWCDRNRGLLLLIVLLLMGLILTFIS